ncbi:hypothetical protein H0H81_008540 [Sphagnurus paluster]|uniref:Uncharacterized protein n=1 Tax=Sphagnurus paluster TaxID=117069 RepID=A0A9P7K4V5_9AGAR|nr:hypothetical protein H0H81_008540 [Sphagnurus paluster]
MLRYMQKSERYHLPNSEQIQLGAKVDPTVHGFDGYVNAGFPQPYEVASASERYVASIRAAIPGLAENNDVASGTPNGVARFQYSITPGNGTFPALGGNTRSSSANAYIYPSLTTKTNLVILTEHQASSIIWHQRRPVALGSRAAGVNFIATQVKDSGNPGPLSVKVRREVIVSSGAIGVGYLHAYN